MSDYSHIGYGAVPGNAADFAKALTAMADHVDGSIEKVIRKACIDLYRAIVEKTPVDTGRAKASWGLATYEANDTQGPRDGYTFNDINAFVEANISEFEFTIHDDKVIIYNNLEYIGHLENGTSQQAPAGMVSISLVEFETFFNNALQGLEGIEPA